MASPSQATLLLQKQLRDLSKNPVDGFSAGLVDESNLFEWSVTIIGPPDTLYDGSFFNAIMTFPQIYPNSPPTVRFTSEFILMARPSDDPNGYEFASERWTPVHTGAVTIRSRKFLSGVTHYRIVEGIGSIGKNERNQAESIVLSIISMLSSPNDESPTNVETAKEWRERKDEFRKKVGRCVRRSQELM